MNILLVDDEQDALDVLAAYIQKDSPEVQIIGTARHLADAKQIILSQQPDLVLFDIRMEEESAYSTSFDLLEELAGEAHHHFDVVFVTAFPQREYMLEAMEYTPVKFITKPVNRHDLREAIQKALKRYEERQDMLRERETWKNQGLKTSPVLFGAIAIPRLDGKIEMVALDEILYIESVKNAGACHIYTTTSKERPTICSMAIGEFDALLDPAQHFFQIHQSIIINLKQLKTYHHAERVATLRNGVTLYASVREGKNLRNFLLSGATTSST